jgi:PAS domain S-box-containing protein
VCSSIQNFSASQERDVFEDTTPASWFALYKQALLELDPSALAARIELALSSIRAQLAELSPASANFAEDRQRLQDALRNLTILQREQRDGPESTGLPFSPYVVLAARDRRWIAISDGVCELLGYARNELLGKRIEELTVPELKPKTEELFEEFVTVGSMDGEYALSHKDGHPVPFHFKARVFPDGAMIAIWYPNPAVS